MKTGKISEPILKRSVLKKISYKDKSVLGRAAVGYDAAVVALDDYKLVTSTQTVVDKRDLHMNRAFIKAVNNLAAMGVEPKYAQISIVLPEGMREIKLKMLMDEMCEFARVRKISITGGNTMVSAGVVNPVVTVSVTGIAGPGGGTVEKPVGLVYVGCYVNGNVRVEEYHFTGNRAKNREYAVVRALTVLREELMKN